MAVQKTRGVPRSKHKDANLGPSRQRYRAGGQGAIRMALRKIQRLVTHCGMTPQQAFNHWDKTRKRRRENLMLSYVERELGKIK